MFHLFFTAFLLGVVFNAAPGAAFLITIPYVQTPLAIIGALLLAYLAYESFKDGLKPLPKTDEASAATQALVYTVLMTKLPPPNPQLLSIAQHP